MDTGTCRCGAISGRQPLQQQNIDQQHKCTHTLGWLYTYPWHAYIHYVHTQVMAAFTRLKTAYDALPGDSIPHPPATWTSATPTEADLNTPFGMLFTAVNHESDPDMAGSLHAELDKAVTLLRLSVSM